MLKYLPGVCWKRLTSWFWCTATAAGQVHESCQSRLIPPMIREPHHKGLCSACSRHTDQTSDPSWGCGWRITTVHISTYRPTDSGHTIVTIGTHWCLEPAWLDYLSLTMVCPLSKAAPNVLIVWFNLPHLLLSIHLGKALCSQEKINSFPHQDQNKSSKGWTVWHKPMLKNQDSVLTIPGENVSS